MVRSIKHRQYCPTGGKESLILYQPSLIFPPFKTLLDSLFMCSMFRKLLCASLPNLPISPKPNTFFTFPILNSLTQNATVSFQHTKPFCSSTKMSDARRPSSVPIPSPDKANRSELLRALEGSMGSSFSSEPLAPNPNPIIIVISGPSGVGKDAVINRLRQSRSNLHFVVTATSRARRPGEVEGKDYYFVSKEEFLRMVDRNELLEHALVYGDYKGVPRKQIREFMAKGYDIVMRVDIQGAQTLRNKLGDSAVFVFVVAESEVDMVERLVDRKTETKEALLVRIATAREEVKHMKNFDYVVVNAKGKLDNAVKLLESIIDAEKAKVNQRNPRV